MATKKTKKKAAPKKPAPKASVSSASKKAASKKTAPARKSAAAKKASAPAKKAAAAASRKAAAPRKSPAHEVVHWEIQAKDPPGLHRFYAAVFDWEIDTDNSMQYGMVKSKGKNGIDGGIGSGSGESRVVVYASVPSIPAALGRIEALGGKTVMPRSDMGYVVIALYEDPEGNVMGLIEG